jgi:hypothetical protein
LYLESVKQSLHDTVSGLFFSGILTDIVKLRRIVTKENRSSTAGDVLPRKHKQIVGQPPNGVPEG